ncbi:MAG: hypothetical protein Q9201_004706 [Fulgogasparrea decipioides]
MLLWVLYLKLWWLWLPLGALTHPSVRTTLGRRAISEILELRDAELPPDQTETLKALAVNGQPSIQQLAPLLVYPDGRRPPPLASRPAGNDTMLNPFWMRYDGPGVFNTTVGKGVNREVPIDWEYPPFTEKKLIAIRGFMDTETTETDISVDVLGWPLGDFHGNLDDGMKIDCNIVVAKGDLIIYEVRGIPKDQVWIRVDLMLPFHQHFNKKIHMFDLPHRDAAAAKKPPTETA